MNTNKFYVYAYIRSTDSPNGLVNSYYYIGKGFANRAWKPHGNGISVPKDRSNIIFLATNLTEKDAFQIEMLFIYLYGRLDLGTGLLRNKTCGGEGPTGIIYTDAMRKARSERCKGVSPSLETREKMRQIRLGRKQSPEAIAKTIAANLGRKDTPETIAKRSASNKGKGLGRKLSPETCAKMSASRTGIKYSPERIAKATESYKRAVAARRSLL